MKSFTSCLTGTVLVILLAGTAGAAPLIADHTSADEFAYIPASWFDTVRAEFDIFYGHTSHGSQIVAGCHMLEDEDGVLYDMPTFHEIGDDLGHNGDTSWMTPTRNYLDTHPDCNMAMWSWCGGCSDNTEAGIAIYLAAMEQLESEYPDVIFVYMTGHLDGSGVDGNLYRSNNQIRDYCIANDKVLFDFADIESWDPDGNYYPDENDGCDWCSDWCAVHVCPPSHSCAHSHCFNCYRKGKAFWWMLSRLAGWAGYSGLGERIAGGGGLSVESVYPNPFNPRTTIKFSTDGPRDVRVAVFDAAGRRVQVLFEGRVAGSRTVEWDGRDATGRRAAAGGYFVKLSGDGVGDVQRITMLK